MAATGYSPSEKYIPKSVIGKGSFGSVTLVESTEDGLLYVIKKVVLDGLSEKLAKDAKAEIAVLQQLSHPNVIGAKEAYMEGQTLYIVLEYADGGDLYKMMKAQKGAKLPESVVLEYFVQICLGLKHIHDRKVLHRDLKAQNIFLTQAGVVKIGDFGMSKRLMTSQENASTSIGTPYYLSPEICESKPYNQKSDMWALGCILYEMCALRHPFDARNIKGLVQKILRGIYRPIPSWYSSDVAHLVSILLARDPMARPTINQLLRMPCLASLVGEHLSADVLEDEFSHTLLHNFTLAATPDPALPGEVAPYDMVSDSCSDCGFEDGLMEADAQGAVAEAGAAAESDDSEQKKKKKKKDKGKDKDKSKDKAKDKGKGKDKDKAKDKSKEKKAKAKGKDRSDSCSSSGSGKKKTKGGEKKKKKTDHERGLEELREMYLKKQRERAEQQKAAGNGAAVDAGGAAAFQSESDDSL